MALNMRIAAAYTQAFYCTLKCKLLHSVFLFSSPTERMTNTLILFHTTQLCLAFLRNIKILVRPQDSPNQEQQFPHDMINILRTPKNALESYSFNYAFLFVCINCKLLFTSVVRRQLISFSRLVAKLHLGMWAVSRCKESCKERCKFGYQIWVAFKSRY